MIEFIPGARRLGRILAAGTFATALVLAGCQSGPVRVDDPETTRVARELLAAGRPAEAATEYLRLAGEAGPDAARRYRLSAVEAFLDAGDTAAAGRVLARDLTGEMPQPDAYRRDVASAELALAAGDAAGALARLGRQPPELPPALVARAGRVQARAPAEVGNNLEAARTLLSIETALGDAGAVARNQREAWELLGRVSAPALERARVPPPDVFGGWIELAIVFDDAFMDPQTFNARLAAWQGRYPGHPAATSIVPELAAASSQLAEQPATVALLLPLDGQFAPAAQAVRDGFMAAWYADDSTGRPVVLVRDSSGDDIWPTYRAVVEEGAALVVGPLRRQPVTDLAAVDTLPVPTIALNNASGAGAGVPADAQGSARAPTDGLFQFALSPEDEAQQVAERAWFAGHGRAAIISPQGTWGDRVSGAFAEAWEGLGGEVVGQTTYEGNAVDLSPPVETLLNIQASEQRYKALRTVVGSRLKGEPRRRQDIDVVFMAAFPNKGRQLRPQFKFHRAGAIPVFSTSHIFTGVADPSADSDIDGVTFGDMPWALAPEAEDAALRRRVAALWPQAVSSYVRLYALGADAYALVSRIGRLRAQPQAEYQGATGRLSVTPDNKVRRRLTWGRFEDGQPVLVDGALSATDGAAGTAPIGAIDARGPLVPR